MLFVSWGILCSADAQKIFVMKIREKLTERTDFLPKCDYVTQDRFKKV